MPFSFFKLEKLKILAFPTAARSGPPQDTFEAMFNPASLSEQYAIEWGRKQALNSSNAQLNYAQSKPSTLTLDLVLDGTGVHEIGLFALAQKSVKTRVDELLKVTWEYNGSIHEPNYLRVEWGSYQLACRLSSVDVKYTLFDRDGSPLRAEVQIVLISDSEANTRALKENKTSPDLTHTRTVRSGDSLPLLTKAIYGSSEHYLQVARWNELDDFRTLTPGTELEFPPIARFTERKGR